MLAGVTVSGAAPEQDAAKLPQYTAINDSGQTVTVKYTPVIDPVVFTAPTPVSLDQMRQAILAGCPTRGWQASTVDDHTIAATLNIRKHKVSVLIAYDTKGYKITYQNSYNLVVSDNSIHRNYQLWVRYLSADIAKKLVF